MMKGKDHLVKRFFLRSAYDLKALQAWKIFPLLVGGLRKTKFLHTQLKALKY